MRFLVLSFLILLGCSPSQDEPIKKKLIESPEESEIDTSATHLQTADTTEIAQELVPDSLIVVDVILSPDSTIKISYLRFSRAEKQIGNTAIRIEYNDQQFEFTKALLKPLYHESFYDDSELFSAKIFSYDSAKKQIMISTWFGVPSSDVSTNAMLILDNHLNLLTVFDDNPGCRLKNRLLDNYLLTCGKIYRETEVFYDFRTKYWLAWSSFLNDSTLFYVEDVQDSTELNNAFVVNFVSQDTLEAFRFRDYGHTIGYTALIDWNERLGLTAYINHDNRQLTTFDTTLTKMQYQLDSLQTIHTVINESNLMKFWGEMESYVIQFDDSGAPRFIVNDN